MELLVLEKNVSKSIPSTPFILYLLYAPPNAPSINLGVGSNDCNFNASLLAIRFRLVLPLALLIFLFRSSIFFFILLLGFKVGVLTALTSNDSRVDSRSLSLSAILVASHFIEQIFFRLNPELVLLDALATLFSMLSIRDLRSSISFLKFFAFFDNLEALFLLCLS